MRVYQSRHFGKSERKYRSFRAVVQRQISPHQRMSWDAVLSSSPTDARDTLRFVLAEPDDTIPLYTPWRMADHRCLAIRDLLSGADEVAILFGLGALLSAHWLA